jgi:hypothetical protein
MNVYFVPHAAQPKFKIGKANDVLDRLESLGELTDFNLEESLHIQLPSVKDARRVEKILHRLFKKWNLPIDKKNRYDGDTEQFELACFPRVVRFLNENADLFDGALPQPLPEVQPRVARAKVTRLNYYEARANAARRRQAAEDEYRRMAMAALSCGVDQICQMGLEVLDKTDAFYPFISIQTTNEALFKRAMAIMEELEMLRRSPAHPPLTRCTYSVMCTADGTTSCRCGRASAFWKAAGFLMSLGLPSTWRSWIGFLRHSGR